MMPQRRVFEIPVRVFHRVDRFRHLALGGRLAARISGGGSAAMPRTDPHLKRRAVARVIVLRLRRLLGAAEEEVEEARLRLARHRGHSGRCRAE